MSWSGSTRPESRSETRQEVGPEPGQEAGADQEAAAPLFEGFSEGPESRPSQWRQ